MTISTLIDKQDNVEIVRDQVSAILALESAAQVTLAKAANKARPDDWRFRVYQERASVWEEFGSRSSDNSEIVNVWWENSAFDKSASNVSERAKSSATINLDCYAYGSASPDPSGGHEPGDQKAAKSVQRCVRLVRNILMSAEYTYLGLRGVVETRWVPSINMFQPQQNNQNVEHIVACRISLEVKFNEFSPQHVPETLDLLSVQVLRTEDGQVLVEADYDYENEVF